MATLVIVAGSGTVVRGEQAEVWDPWVRQGALFAMNCAGLCVASGVRYDERPDHVGRHSVRPAEPSLLPYRLGDRLGGALIVAAVFGSGDRLTLAKAIIPAWDWTARVREWSMTPERFWEHVVRIAMNGALNISQPASANAEASLAL